MKKAIWMLVVAGLIAGLTGSAVAQVKTGDEAPVFDAVDIAGSLIGLSEFKGRYVVLEWINYDCPFVKKHYDSGNMQELQKEFTGKDVVWLAICSSAPDKQGFYEASEHKRILGEKGFAGTTLLLDPEGIVGKQYAAKTTPHMFVIDPEGKMIYQGAIDDNSSANKEDAKTAKNYVRAALESAMAGQPVEAPATAPYGCSVKY